MILDLGAGVSRMRVSKNKLITVKFPNEYQDEKLRGQEAVFDLTVTKIEEPHLPELDERFFSTFGIEEGGEEMDLISAMEDMDISNAVEKKEKADAILDKSNPVFAEDRCSSKIDTVLQELRKLQEKAEQGGGVEKAVIVSQWTSMLMIMKSHINTLGMKCAEINGQVAVKLRGGIVEDFNIISFLSHKIKRKMRSTLGCEVQAVCEAANAAELLRAYLAEVRSGQRLELRDRTAIESIPMEWRCSQTAGSCMTICTVKARDLRKRDCCWTSRLYVTSVIIV